METSQIVLGDGIPIWWQRSDSSVLAAAAAQTPSGRATSGSSPVSATASATNTGSAGQIGNAGPGGGGGLSTGAKIGLGVGIPLGIIALLAIGFLLWRKKKRSHQPVAAHEVHDTQVHPQTEYKDAPPAGWGSPGHGHAAPGAYGGGGADVYRNEYQPTQQYHEMQSNNAGYADRHELPGGVQQR